MISADLSLKLAVIAENHPDLLMNAALMAALNDAYTEGRLDGALAAATLIANKPQAPAVSPRRERLTADLEVGRKQHKDVDFDAPVMIKNTVYKIVGFNRNAPRHAFIIEGPQGGRYKCPVDMIRRGQEKAKVVA